MFGVATVKLTDSHLLNFTLQSPLIFVFFFESTVLSQFMTPEPPLLVILPAPEIFTFNVCCWTEELLELAPLETEEDDELLDELLDELDPPEVVNVGASLLLPV